MEAAACRPTAVKRPWSWQATSPHGVLSSSAASTGRWLGSAPGSEEERLLLKLLRTGFATVKSCYSQANLASPPSIKHSPC